MQPLSNWRALFTVCLATLLVGMLVASTACDEEQPEVVPRSTPTVEAPAEASPTQVAGQPAERASPAAMPTAVSTLGATPPPTQEPTPAPTPGATSEPSLTEAWGPVYLIPGGEEVCGTRVFGSGAPLVAGSYDVASLNKPAFLTYDTQDLERHCVGAIGMCTMKAAFCVSALDSAPAGFHDLEVEYRVFSGPFASVPQWSGTLSLTVTVLAP